MESNVYSIERPEAAEPVGLERLEAAVQDLAAQDVDTLPDGVAAARVLALRRLVDRLEGQWLRELAGVDGRGAAGADEDRQADSTASWLRGQLRLGAGAAHQAVRTARALFRGPLTGTAQALVAGEISSTHASVLAAGTRELPPATAAEAEPVLLDAAQRLGPPRLRRVIAHLRYVADPDAADAEAQRRYERRGLWLTPTWEGMVGIGGLLDPEAGQTLLQALEPLARPSGAEDQRSGDQRNADALAELARRNLEGGGLPQTGGVRPQLLVTVDVERLQNRHGSPAGELGWVGLLGGEGCRRLACDGALTRMLVTRRPDSRHSWDGWEGHQHDGQHRVGAGADAHHHGDLVVGGWDGASGDATGNGWHGNDNGAGGNGIGAAGLAGRLQAAVRLLPPVLGGGPTQPLEVGRTTRTVSPAQRHALTVRDGGCSFPGCDRPQSWCEAHHLRHWADGGPTDLANLALVCRAHHRAVHEGGWQLGRDPHGRMTATPPRRRQPGAT